jgi:hypothetical protein
MGVDFLKSKAKAFTKGLDSDRLASTRRHLFAHHPEHIATGAIAKVVGPQKLAAGDDVLVRADGDRLVVVVDLAETAVFEKPPDSLVQAIRQSGGYAKGRIEAAYPTLELVKVLVQ